MPTDASLLMVQVTTAATVTLCDCLDCLDKASHATICSVSSTQRLSGLGLSFHCTTQSLCRSVRRAECVFATQSGGMWESIWFEPMPRRWKSCAIGRRVFSSTQVGHSHPLYLILPASVSHCCVSRFHGVQRLHLPIIDVYKSIRL